MKKVTKAVIPAAGYGTRMLPLTKALPKEMVPIVDKPSIQYIAEEAVASGITDILIILSRGKDLIENHFDRLPELENNLASKGKNKELEELLGISGMANFYFIRQKEMRGLGHAVSCARAFTGDEPFAVLYGDDVIIGEPPATKQLIDAYEARGLGVCGINAVPTEMLSRYCSLKVDALEQDRWFHVTDMIEKPAAGQEFSNYSILGRVVLPPSIYEILDNTAPGAGGEIQLTDAMCVLAKNGGMTGVDFIGRRYDMGNKLEVAKAGVEMAMKHPVIGEEFTAYLKTLLTK